MSTIKKLVVHCSDTPDTMMIGVKEIRQWHTARPPLGNGWADIGYHKVIRRDGRLETGRYENGDSVLEGKEIGAHVHGHNSDSLAICWVGRNAITSAQNETLLNVLAQWCRTHNLTAEDVYGHRELAPESGKTCPNLDMPALRAALRLVLKGSRP